MALEPASKPLSTSGLALKWQWFRKNFGAVLATEPHSAARAQAIDELIGVETTDWRGRSIKFARNTIYTWLREYEAKGAAGLARGRRTDVGTTRYHVSKRWDEFVSGRIDREAMERIGDGIKQYLGGCIKGGEKRKIVLFLGREKLKELTALHGVRPADERLFNRVCEIPVRLYRDLYHLRQVYEFKRDRKRFDDAQPRIKRTTVGLRPMQYVVADVHHCNVLVQRDDGTTTTPKIIAFMDMATRRVWCHLIQFDGRGAVRNIDVITAFVEMACDPLYGLPEHLLIDNGKEYLFADYVADALALNIRGFGEDASHRVHRALPYNAAAKPIEAWFGHFEQTYLFSLQGYIGDDRMKPMQEKPGRLPAAFGTFDQFAAQFQALLTAYEHVPQQGDLKGQSPHEALRGHVEGGWAATVMDETSLTSVFTTPETRIVDRGMFRCAGRVWYAPDVGSETKIVVRIPAWHGFNALRVETMKGKPLGIARPQEEVAFTDLRGAKEAGMRKTKRRKAVRDLDTAYPSIDSKSDLAAFASRQLPIAANDPNGIVQYRGRDADENLLAITPDKSAASASNARRQSIREENDEMTSLLREARERRARNAS
ncbi:hypothetical protein [Fulvimarina sp. MAC3]|uniref:hypothetical protein n=1 Tax=Fulvimarina sp. MAC3 TaxID=3148887 RepID=UPI0031FDE338